MSYTVLPIMMDRHGYRAPGSGSGRLHPTKRSCDNIQGRHSLFITRLSSGMYEAFLHCGPTTSLHTPHVRLHVRGCWEVGFLAFEVTGANKRFCRNIKARVVLLGCRIPAPWNKTQMVLESIVSRHQIEKMARHYPSVLQ